MADLSQESRNYVRESWTLADLKALVAEVDSWDDDSRVLLSATDDFSQRGTIEVSRDL